MQCLQNPLDWAKFYRILRIFEAFHKILKDPATWKNLSGLWRMARTWKNPTRSWRTLSSSRDSAYWNSSTLRTNCNEIRMRQRTKFHWKIPKWQCLYEGFSRILRDSLAFTASQLKVKQNTTINKQMNQWRRLTLNYGGSINWKVAKKKAKINLDVIEFSFSSGEIIQIQPLLDSFRIVLNCNWLRIQHRRHFSFETAFQFHCIQLHLDSFKLCVQINSFR